MRQLAEAPTHAYLVGRAARWLTNTCRCPVVLTELATSHWETPDAIGFDRPHSSILVECKTSRADFLRDRKKRPLPEMGAGRARYYMAAPGVITPDDLACGWGLLEVGEYIVRVRVRPTPRQEGDYLRSDRAILYSVARRCMLGQCYRPGG